MIISIDYSIMTVIFCLLYSLYSPFVNSWFLCSQLL